MKEVLEVLLEVLEVLLEVLEVVLDVLEVVLGVHVLKILCKKLSGGSVFPIFGPWSPEFSILDLRFGFYAKFQPRGWILRSVHLKLTIVFWF